MRQELKRNVTTLLLLAPIDLSFTELDYYGLVEAYVKDKKRKEDFNNFYVLLLFKLGDNFQSYLNSTLKENKYYVTDYDYDGYVVVVFIYPEEFQDDYNKIVEGKYSQVSKAFKEVFPQKVMIITGDDKSFFANSMAYKVIHNFSYVKEDLAGVIGIEIPKNAECWKAFEPDLETLDIDKIKEKELEHEICDTKSFR